MIPQKVKRQPKEGEKYLHISNKRPISQIFKELLRLNNKQTNNQFNRQRTGIIDIPQSRWKNGQQVCEKMCISISHQQNANQNHSELSLHTHSQNDRQWQVVASTQRRQNLHTLLARMQNGTAAPENSLAVLLQTLNTELLYDSTIPQPDICPSEMKTYVHRNCTPAFTAVFIIAPKWITQMSTDWYIKCGTFMQRNVTHDKQKAILIHVTTWMNLENIKLCETPVPKDYVLHDFIYMTHLE